MTGIRLQTVENTWIRFSNIWLFDEYDLTHNAKTTKVMTNNHYCLMFANLLTKKLYNDSLSKSSSNEMA